jgi:hypothetical protein
MKKLIITLAISTLLLNSCEKEPILVGKKVVNLNFRDVKTGLAVNDIYCFIGRPSFPVANIVRDTVSDINGNCKLEVDFKATDNFYFLIENDPIFNGNKTFVSKFHDPNSKYRVIGNQPDINFKKKNDFNFDIQLIPLIRIPVIFEFKKAFDGSPKFDIIEKNESLYYISKGGPRLNSAWFVGDKDSVNCYVSAVDITTLVYSFNTNSQQTVFSKSITIDPNKIDYKKINVVFE